MSGPTFVLDGADALHRAAGAGPERALAVHDGKVVAVGQAEAWSALGSDAQTIDLAGRVVVPGFTDAHVHWAGFALTRRQLVLGPGMSLADVQAAVGRAAAAGRDGEWIVGRGWDHSHWGRWPTAADLDGVAQGPVVLRRKDGHVAWASTAALRAAGVTNATVAPSGGAIDRADGTPTGILRETAMRLVYDVVPHPSAEERRAALVDSWPEAWRLGITGCHDMGHRRRELWDDLQALRRDGDLGLRFVWYFYESVLDEVIDEGLQSGSGDAWLSVGGLKVFLDGTLGSQTAHMLEPFEGQPGNRGLPTLESGAFRGLVRRAADAGLATAVHAIGDGANRRALDAFAALSTPNGHPRRALRHRIEHAQLLDPDDIPRFAALGVVASMQPIHAVSDRDVADRYWGRRARTAYAWRALQEAGARLAFGSDAPVESPDVFSGLLAAVARKGQNGEPADGWRPGQCVDLDSALDAYTTGAAFAAGQEHELGGLVPGRRADLVILDRDPRAVEAEDLPSIRVLATMIDGRWAWQAPDIELPGPWR